MKSRQMLSVIVLAGLANLLAACGGASSPAARPAATEEPPIYEYAPEMTEAMTEEAAAEYPLFLSGDAANGIPEATQEAAEPGQPPQDMFFQDYGTNPFVDVTQDHFSTFAIDVDTASYTLARSYLRDGNLPPPDAIRLEEFINFFRQDYSLPQGKGFSINVDAAPTPFNVEDSYVMRVGIQGYDVPDDQRPDANLVFVIDISGSMAEDNRLGAVKSALTSLIHNLRPTDTVGIVVYGSNGRILLNPTPVSNSQQITDAISQLQPDGSTNAEEGLRLGYEVATENFDKERINRIILCSDGVANVGATGPDAILQIVRQQAAEGIALTTVGFGMGNFNDVLMEQLANDGDGEYHYVDTWAEAEKLFDTGLTGTLLTIGKDAKIQVEFNPDAIQAYRLMGYENRAVADQDFRNNQVDAGEIGAGHNVTALYEIIPSAQAQPDAIIAIVRMRWADPDTGEVTELEQVIRVSDVLSDFEQASPRFRLDIAAAAFADLLSEGGWAQNATYDDVLSIAQQAARDLPQDEDVQEFPQIVAAAAQLNQ